MVSWLFAGGSSVVAVSEETVDLAGFVDFVALASASLVILNEAFREVCRKGVVVVVVLREVALTAFVVDVATVVATVCCRCC